MILLSGSQDSKFSNGSLLGIFVGDAGDHHKLASITAVLPAQLVKKAGVRKSPDKTKRFGVEAGGHLDKLASSGKHLQSPVLAVTNHHIASEEWSCAISLPGTDAQHTCHPEECPQG